MLQQDGISTHIYICASFIYTGRRVIALLPLITQYSFVVFYDILKKLDLVKVGVYPHP